jgi:hypothetical protein
MLNNHFNFVPQDFFNNPFDRPVQERRFDNPFHKLVDTLIPPEFIENH